MHGGEVGFYSLQSPDPKSHGFAFALWLACFSGQENFGSLAFKKRILPGFERCFFILQCGIIVKNLFILLFKSDITEGGPHTSLGTRFRPESSLKGGHLRGLSGL